mmetsp:Transcript_12714/g.35254  ORF Transcript_12714/g.35254 Transcript_12714/m.35254 type:complete len:163 (-) Transcript_12714:1583-2071(-)
MKLIHAAAIVAYASAVQAFYLRPSARRRTGSAWAELGNSICSTNEGPTVTKTGTKETAPFSSLDSIQSTANGDYFVAVSSQTLSKNFRAQGGVELYHFDRSPCLWKHDTANITGSMWTTRNQKNCNTHGTTRTLTPSDAFQLQSKQKIAWDTQFRSDVTGAL